MCCMVSWSSPRKLTFPRSGTRPWYGIPRAARLPWVTSTSARSQWDALYLTTWVQVIPKPGEGTRVYLVLRDGDLDGIEHDGRTVSEEMFNRFCEVRKFDYISFHSTLTTEQFMDIGFSPYKMRVKSDITWSSLYKGKRHAKGLTDWPTVLSFTASCYPIFCRQAFIHCRWCWWEGISRPF